MRVKTLILSVKREFRERFTEKKKVEKKKNENLVKIQNL